MSKYNHYATTIDRKVKEAFEKYNKLSAELDDAKAEKRKNHNNAKAALEAQVRYEDVHGKVYQCEMEMQRMLQEFRNARRELESELAQDFALDPAAVDPNTMALISSGCMKYGDFLSLANKAESENNVTMLRLIGNAAAEMAAKEKDQSKASGLIVLSHHANAADGSQWLEAYDNLVEVVRRTIDNPSMFPYWSDLTGETIESF